MKFRVRFYIGRTYWTSDHDTQEAAAAEIKSLLTNGHWDRRKSGVTVVYPPHRISKIVVRRV